MPVLAAAAGAELGHVLAMGVVAGAAASTGAAKLLELGVAHLRSRSPDARMASELELQCREDVVRALKVVEEPLRANLTKNPDLTATEFRAVLEAFARAVGQATDEKKLTLIMAGVVNSFDPELHQQSMTKNLFRLAGRHSYGALRLLRAIVRKDWAVVACGEPGQPDERLAFHATQPGERLRKLPGWNGVSPRLEPSIDMSTAALWEVIEPWRRYLTIDDMHSLKRFAVPWPEDFFDVDAWGQVSSGILFSGSLAAEHLLRLEADRLVNVGAFVQNLPPEHALHPIEVFTYHPPTATALGRLLTRFLEAPPSEE